MPGKNIEKIYAPESYYHVYNRGVEKRVIFIDDYDYRTFLNLIKRYLSKEPVRDKKGRVYDNFRNDIELNAFCLMPNHFHLLLYVKRNPERMAKLLRNINTSYVVYFNKRHHRVGHLLQDRYRAVMIRDESHLWHISRYIHMNPQNYEDYQYSSLNNYISNESPDWLDSNRILKMFKESNVNYQQFLNDYIPKREELKALTKELY